MHFREPEFKDDRRIKITPPILLALLVTFGALSHAQEKVVVGHSARADLGIKALLSGDIDFRARHSRLEG